MKDVLHVLSVVLLWAGVIVVLLSAIGVARSQTVYDRLHFLGPAATLGVFFIGMALLLAPGQASTRVKIALVTAIVLGVSPVVTHATGRAAYLREHDQGSDSKEPAK